MKENNFNNRTPNTDRKIDQTYSYYSNVLKKPFDSVEELTKAEDAYYAEQRAKEDKAAQKKSDAKKVEDAFKAMNQARRDYKENLTKLTAVYAEDLKKLKDAFDSDKSRIQNALADAENGYSIALKEFTDKYENYHVTLRDGDFETTISNDRQKSVDMLHRGFDLFDWIFGF